MTDLRAIASLLPLGVDAAIVGKALYAGKFTLEEALEAVRRRSGRPSRAAGMTVAVRVIPCLDVDGGRVVKGVNFLGLRDAGDPVELAAAYDADGADELVFLDITASSDDRETMLEVVARTADQVFIPLTVGGGVRSADDVDRLLRAGADKVSLNTAAIARPELLTEVAARFGSQCIVISVDARRVAGTARRVRGDHPRRAARHRARRRGVGGQGRRARRRGDPAQLDGRRRHQGRVSTCR